MSAPVKHTCPDIDNAIKLLKSVSDECKYAIEDSKVYRDIDRDIDRVIDILEDLRSSNDELRTWGNELEDELKKADEYSYGLEEKLKEFTEQKQPQNT